jgi:hypothetical protein
MPEPVMIPVFVGNRPDLVPDHQKGIQDDGVKMAFTHFLPDGFNRLIVRMRSHRNHRKVHRKNGPLTCEDTSMDPLCNSTNRFVMARPSPVPPNRREAEPSICSKALKMRSRSSRPMLIPVSATRMATFFPSNDASTLTEPLSVRPMIP